MADLSPPVGRDGHDAATALESARDALAVAVANVPHYIETGIAARLLTGDEPHTEDCPGCAVTKALVALQEALDGDA